MLVGGTLTQLVASLGTPFAFDPPAGCVLFLDEVAERPYRLDRMLTQLRLSGLLARASAIVFDELPRCDEPGGSPTARDTVRRVLADFRGPVLFGLPSGHTDGPTLTLPFGVMATRGRRATARADHRGGGGRVNGSTVTDMTRIHLIGICGTAMATLAALLKSRGYDVRGSDQNVYPPMSDFLREQGITTLQGYDAGAHHRGHRSRRRRQRDLARQPRARGSARSEDPLLLAARGGPRPLSLGRALDRHRRHARQDDDDVAGRLAARARRRRSERVHRRHRRELREQLPRSAAAASS